MPDYHPDRTEIVWFEDDEGIPLASVRAKDSGDVVLIGEEDIHKLYRELTWKVKEGESE